jgi:DNA transformation protein
MDGPRFPDRSVCRFRPGRDPPDVFRFRHLGGGVNFALALRSGLYFRADEQTIPRFEAEGSRPFQYQTRAGTVTVNSYWELPARLFDDQEELGVWARAALAAAQRAALWKRPKAKAPTAKAKVAIKKKKSAKRKKSSP